MPRVKALALKYKAYGQDPSNVIDYDGGIVDGTPLLMYLLPAGERELLLQKMNEVHQKMLAKEEKR